MNREPLVAITIPTFNSEKTLGLCLEAIHKQTYRHIAVSIIDGYSTDKTKTIAQKFHVAKFITYPGALLGAREMGARSIKSDYTLLLDSDQVLEKDAVERAVNEAQKKLYNIIILEEGVYKKTNMIELLFHYDRVLSHAVKDFNPYTGVLLPRFFKTSLLLNAFSQIPQKYLTSIGGQDHAVIYFEAYALSQKVTMIPHAVTHIEPNSLFQLWKKFYRWGYTSFGAHYGKYDSLLLKKERFRTGLFSNGLAVASIASILLLVLKGIPFKLGFFTHVLQKKFSHE